MPFTLTYLCEAGFSTLLAIKTKVGNKLAVESDLRCALSTTGTHIQASQKDTAPATSLTLLCSALKALIKKSLFNRQFYNIFN